MRALPRRGPSLVLGLALAALGALPATMARASGSLLHSNDDENYSLYVRDNWTWGRASDYEKMEVKEVAERRIEKLQDGSPGGGIGARILLSVQAVPKDVDPDYETWLRDYQILLEAKAKIEEDTQQSISDEMKAKIGEAREKCEKEMVKAGGVPAVQELLLHRYDKDRKKWPQASVSASELFTSSLPTALVEVTADAPNLDGTAGPCEGRMTVWVIRKKLYRLAIFLWKRTRDPDHLRADRDEIEMSFEHHKTEASPRRPDAKSVDPAGVAGGGAVAAKNNSDKGTPIKDLAIGFEVVKPKRFENTPIDRALPANQNTCFKFEAHDLQGAEAIVSVEYFRGGGAVNKYDFDRYVVGIWDNWLKTHPKGPFATIAFPAITEKVPFLSLPDFTKKIPTKRPPTGKDGKPDPVTRGDLEKLGVIQEAKQIKLGPERVHGTWRWGTYGILDRVGDEYLLNYTLSTSEISFVIRVFLRKEGAMAFLPELQKILSSFRLLDKPK